MPVLSTRRSPGTTAAASTSCEAAQATTRRVKLISSATLDVQEVIWHYTDLTLCIMPPLNHVECRKVDNLLRPSPSYLLYAVPDDGCKARATLFQLCQRPLGSPFRDDLGLDTDRQKQTEPVSVSGDINPLPRRKDLVALRWP
jgi:hypothetical protein